MKIISYNSLLLDNNAIQKIAIQWQIVATDKAGTGLDSAVDLLVHIDDVNDNAPQFDQETYSFEVNGTATKGATVWMKNASFGRKINDYFIGITEITIWLRNKFKIRINYSIFKE